MKRVFKAIAGLLAAAVLAVGFMPASADAKIEGISGDTVTVPGQRIFNLSSKTGNITTGDGGSLFIWGYANEDPTPSFCAAGGCVQYTGPTLLVTEGDIVVVNFKNNLSVASSIVFPGQTGVTAVDKVGAAIGGVPGYMTRDAKPGGGEVTYTFTASQPGTYLYHSGTRPDLQVEMGLVGAIVVRPLTYATPGNKIAYANTPTYDYEHLFLLTEADPLVHAKVEQGRINEVDTATARPTFWFLNGRTLPDTLSGNYAVNMPAQPYGSVVQMHPFEKALYRILNGGRDAHPFHTHGGHHTVIAKNGRVLGATGAVVHPLIGTLPSGAYSVYTSGISPGETWEALMTMNFDTLGWDAYGHGPLDAAAPNECSTLAGGLADPACPHGRQFTPGGVTSALPVTMPDQNDITGGQFWSGSAFLGSQGQLPPGEGGFNPNSGFFFMQHSHAEKELTNNNIFPGGMATFLIIENPNVVIPAE